MIKNILLLFSCFISLAFISCEKDEYEPTTEEIDSILSTKDTTEPYFINNPLPIGSDTLRVLAIGNSYTDDGVAYIQEITNGMNIPKEKYCVYVTTNAAATLKYWRNEITSNKEHKISRSAGTISMNENANTMKDIIAQPWDVIVLQQYSDDAIHYSSFDPYLQNIITFIKDNCSNKKVAIAWQLIHSYQNSHKSGFKSSEARWKAIVYATVQMYVTDGIDIIIPTGTAIQNARNTELNNDAELTRDKIHLGFGVGKYIAACTWIQTLFTPVFGIDMQSSTATHALYASEQDENVNISGFIKGSSIPVTAENRSLCQSCAVHACQTPFALYKE